MAKKTIQAGVDAAGSGDTVLVTNGEYILTGQITISKTITVCSVNGPIGTIVNGNGQVTLSRCFYLGANCTLDGFTVTNGYALNAAGGGVYCGHTAAVITDCLLSGNTASYGGGAYYGTLNNCTLNGNTASYGGGAYYGTLNNCTLSSNMATYGGGAYCGTLNNCTLSDNSTIVGGGADGGTLNYCTLVNNSADSWGGGAYDSTLNNCMLASNTASYQGGGASGGTLNYCTLTANSVINGNGGGAYSGVLNNCTLSGNTASYQGGGAAGSTLNNCTLTANSATNNDSTGGGTYGGVLNNCIVFYNNGTNNIAGGTIQYTCAPNAPEGFGNITNAPMFVNTNAGNYRLSAGSHCINAGYNALAPEDTLVDLDGNLRIWNVTVDMGAYEYGSVPPDPAVIGPVIKANGSTNDISINSGANLSITVRLNPGEFAGVEVDWWVIARAGSSWFYLHSTAGWTQAGAGHPVYQGGLFNLPATEVLNTSGLPTGSYVFYFAVDYPMDGILNYPDGPILVDAVNVTVQ